MPLTVELKSWQPVLKPDSPLFHCPQCDQVDKGWNHSFILIQILNLIYLIVVPTHCQDCSCINDLVFFIVFFTVFFIHTILILNIKWTYTNQNIVLITNGVFVIIIILYHGFHFGTRRTHYRCTCTVRKCFVHIRSEIASKYKIRDY